MVDTDLTSRLGVNIVEGVVLSEFGWVFREQHVSDEGIDAQVETKLDGKTTGRLIAVQIKAGPAYFDEPKDDGWVFRFGERQARLWLHHALPVILVLVDVDERIAYWQRLTSTTVKSTGKRYKVHVPRSNQLPLAKEMLEHIASDIEMRAAERYEVALTTLPPQVAGLIAKIHDADAERAAVLALHLSEGRLMPASTAETLILASPHWLLGAEGDAWECLALFAAAYGALTESADAFELAAAAGDSKRGRRLAAAGINAMRDDPRRASALLDSAAPFENAELWVRIGRSVLAHPDGSADVRAIEPPLDPADDKVRSDAFTQSFLCEQYIRAGEIDSAIEHARRALELEPENSDYMSALAGALARRAMHARGGRGDLSEAVSLLTRAVDQRHAWAGSTEDVLEELVKALTLTGDNEGVLKYSLPPPLGIALPDEAARPHVSRHALFSAYLLSREELVAQIAGRMGDSARDRLERARVGVLNLSADEQIELWTEVADGAERAHDYQELLGAVTHMARLGRDESRRLEDLVARNIVPEGARDLAASVAQARTDLSAGLPGLRTLARADIAAAEFLVEVLVDADRFEEAAAACRAAHERFHQDYFLISEAQVYIQAEDFERAERVALNAVRTSDFPRERGRLLTFLAGRAADRGDWTSAEDYLSRVLPLHSETRSDDVWRLIIAQLNRGEAARAAETVRKYAPNVRTSDEATLWLQAMSSQTWDKAVASEALSLAVKFETETKVSLPLLWHIIQGTASDPDDTPPSERETAPDAAPLTDSRPVVPADLHKRAFEAIERHVDRNPDSTAIRRLQGTPEELIEFISEMLKSNAERNKAIRDLLEKVQQGNLPVGLLATGTGKSYALLLIQQAAGPMVAAAAQDDEHAMDQDAARDALDQAIVIDTSALLLTSQLNRGGYLRGHFADIQMPAASRRDILRATVEVRGLSARSGTLGWDDSAQRPIYSELTAAELLRYQSRAENLEAATAETRTRAVTELSLFPDLADGALDDSWLGPIQLAHDISAALWSDDVGQRRLARSVGVATFGTPALVEVLNERELDRVESSDTDRVQELIAERQAWVREFIRESVVDVPAHLEDVLAQAQHDEWQPLAAATVLTRPSWWAWQTNALGDWATFIRSAKRAHADTIEIWQHAAMIGVSRTYVNRDFGSAMLAVLAVIGLGEGSTVDDVVLGVGRARDVADAAGLPDPAAHVPSAVQQLSGPVGIGDPEGFSQAVLESLSDHADTVETEALASVSEDEAEGKNGEAESDSSPEGP